MKNILTALALFLFLSGCGTISVFQARQASPEEDFFTTLSKVTIADLDRGIEIATEQEPKDEEIIACYPVLKDYVASREKSKVRKEAIGPFSIIAKSRGIRSRFGGGLPKELKFACAPLLMEEQAFVRRLAVLAGTRGAVKLPDL